MPDVQVYRVVFSKDQTGQRVASGVQLVSRMLTLPTSRGSVTLASPSASDLPLMNNSYFSTDTHVAILV
jgi:hypothetical protein